MRERGIATVLSSVNLKVSTGLKQALEVSALPAQLADSIIF